MNSNANVDMPLGLGMALSKNPTAMNYYSSLSKTQQDSIINHTHQIKSKREMQTYVNSLTDIQTLN